jgi:hypothetical protein
MTSVTSLHGTPIKGEPLVVEEDVVAMLEGLLEEAKSGELRAIGYAAVYHNNDCKNEWEGDATIFSLYGAISLLYHEYTDALKRI